MRDDDRALGAADDVGILARHFDVAVHDRRVLTRQQVRHREAVDAGDVEVPPADGPLVGGTETGHRDIVLVLAAREVLELHRLARPDVDLPTLRPLKHDVEQSRDRLELDQLLPNGLLPLRLLARIPLPL